MIEGKLGGCGQVQRDPDPYWVLSFRGVRPEGLRRVKKFIVTVPVCHIVFVIADEEGIRVFRKGYPVLMLVEFNEVYR